MVDLYGKYVGKYLIYHTWILLEVSFKFSPLFILKGFMIQFENLTLQPIFFSWMGEKPTNDPWIAPCFEVFDGLEGVSVGGFTDDYFERTLGPCVSNPVVGPTSTFRNWWCCFRLAQVTLYTSNLLQVGETIWRFSFSTMTVFVMLYCFIFSGIRIICDYYLFLLFTVICYDHVFYIYSHRSLLSFFVVLIIITTTASFS